MIKKGFTLAEVLVTLLVIGVIAALTIPQLINSTEERQFKTAYKKAVSTIANATELMEANEVSCSVATNEDLAKCMKHAIKGTTLSNLFMPEALADDDNNILVTQDGMVFQFWLPVNYEDQMASLKQSNANYKAPKRAISKICKPFSSDKNYYDIDGSDSDNYCQVWVDLDGYGKNSTSFDDFSTVEDLLDAGDIQILGFSGTGEVRPAYTNEVPDSAFNKGFAYLYGEEAFENLKENYEPEEEEVDCCYICFNGNGK